MNGEELISLDVEDLVYLLENSLQDITIEDLFLALELETRKVQLILLRAAIKCKVEAGKFVMSLENAERKAKQIAERCRKNHARRVYAQNSLFALREIRKRYPDYTEEMLISDLIFKKVRAVKSIARREDFRSRQLQKHADILKYSDPLSHEYHRSCIQIALLQYSHNAKRDINLTVCLKVK